MLACVPCSLTGPQSLLYGRAPFLLGSQSSEPEARVVRTLHIPPAEAAHATPSQGFFLEFFFPRGKGVSK